MMWQRTHGWEALNNNTKIKVFFNYKIIKKKEDKKSENNKSLGICGEMCHIGPYCWLSHHFFTAWCLFFVQTTITFSLDSIYLSFFISNFIL